MPRAYIVLARNDLDDSLLNIQDLKPHSSKRNQVLDGAGQTGLVTHYFLDGINTAISLVGGVVQDDGSGRTGNFGLSAYFAANIENQNAGEALTDAEAIACAVAVEGRVAAGQSLTAADVNTILVAEVGAGCSLTAGDSTGDLEEILRILAGERYTIPNGADIEVGGNFVPGLGFFVTRPNVEQPQSVRHEFTTTAASHHGPAGTVVSLPVRGKSPYGRVIPVGAPVQTVPQDVQFQDQRVWVDTGDLALSALSGQLSHLKSANFTWQNPDFTYGAAGDATTIDGTNIDGAGDANPFEARALVVYDAQGNVI